MQQNLSMYYRFEEASKLCECFNKFVDTLDRQQASSVDKYPWLDPEDERRNMMDREILEKYIFGNIMSEQRRKNEGDGYAI